MVFKDHKMRGGAALEYLIVTVFASIVAFGFITVTMGVLKERLNKKLSSLGMEDVVERLNFLNESSEDT